MISASNEQLQQELEYTLLKPDHHSWWISKMQSGSEDTLEKRYAIKLCFKLGENATETYGMLNNLAITEIHIHISTISNRIINFDSSMSSFFLWKVPEHLPLMVRLL